MRQFQSLPPTDPQPVDARINRGELTFETGFQRLCVGRRVGRTPARSAFLLSCGARKTCNRFWRLSSRFLWESAACIPIALRYRNRRTACSYAVQTHSEGIFQMGRYPRAESCRILRSVRPCGFRAAAEFLVRIVPALGLGAVPPASRSARDPNPGSRVADTFCHSWILELGIRD